MNSRLIVALVLFANIATFARSDANEWTGITTAVICDAKLVRGNKAFRLIPASGLQIGDRLITGRAGAASISLGDGQVIHLGPDTTVTIDVAREGSRLNIKNGELRATVASNEQLEIIAGAATFDVSNAIARVRYIRGVANVMAEHGAINASSGQRLLGRITQEEEYAVDASGVITRTQHTPWAVDPERFRLLAAVTIRPAPLPIKDPREFCPDADSSLQSPADGASFDSAQTTDSGEQDTVATDAKDSAAAFVANLSLGSLSGTTNVARAAAGTFSDANQDTLQGTLTTDAAGVPAGDPFPGAIHLVTGETAYDFGSSVKLNSTELANLFPSGQPAYYSIGVGSAPDSQITTDLSTGTGPQPNSVPVPKFDLYVVELDQFNLPDAILDPAGAAAFSGVAGLLGSTPTAPTVTGATPLEDDRAEINSRATFAMGEIRLQANAAGELGLAIRRSDQDRTIIKDPGNDDANDFVTANSQVTEFNDVPDPRFQPQAPTVKVPAPGAFDTNGGTFFSRLNNQRRAAVTTLMADSLSEYARRTGQTRFVIRDGGGQQVIDITGYRKN